MKASDRAILLGLLILGVGASFWFFALSPKREQAAELEASANAIRSDIAAQQQVVAAAREAQEGYERNYTELVVLGKAAPADGDTPSLLQQLISLSDDSQTTFDVLTLDESAPPTPTGPGLTTADQAQTAAAPAPAPPALPATEATASRLPLGASVGPAGLGILPYSLEFTGDFFQVSDLMEGIDDLIGADGKAVRVGGRLLTVNGFEMTKTEEGDDLEVSLSVSSYVLPDSQGLTAGATATGPPPSVPFAVPTPVATAPAP